MASLRIGLRTLVLLTAIYSSVAAPTSAAQYNLIDASAAGDLDQVRTLLAERADVNAKNTDGLTALMIASQYDRQDVVEVLLGRAADMHAEDLSGALMIAASRGYLDVVRALVAANVDTACRRVIRIRM